VSPDPATRFEPSSSELTEPFWDATRQRRYLVQWCTACGHPIFYPREVCPTCLSSASLTWRESNGTGTVYAVSVQHRPGNPTMAGRVPYTVALVELDAGGDRSTVRVMSNVVNCDPLGVTVGQEVVLAWEPLSDGRNLPVFEPAAPGGGRP
jgi:uncharacterized OB-fold protein